MALRRVIQLGDPRLKAKNKVITDFDDPKLHKLIQDLKDTMNKTGLVGIAAPQIGENYTVFVTQPRNTKARNIGKEDIFRVYINPAITSFSDREVIIYEGCGSVVRGTLFGPVKRAKEITVKAHNQMGKKFQITADGLLARVIQHEYDHLSGIEFTEKVSDYGKLISEAFYRKNIRNSQEAKTLTKITRIEYKKI